MLTVSRIKVIIVNAERILLHIGLRIDLVVHSMSQPGNPFGQLNLNASFIHKYYISCTCKRKKMLAVQIEQPISLFIFYLKQ